MLSGQSSSNSAFASQDTASRSQLVGGNNEICTVLRIKAEDFIRLIPDENKRIALLEKIMIHCFDNKSMMQPSSSIAFSEELLSQLVKLDIEKNVIVGNNISCIGLDLTSSEKKYLVIDDLLEKFNLLLKEQTVQTHNHTFKFYDIDAQTVHLAGSFNNWLNPNENNRITNDSLWEMKKGDEDGQWLLTVALQAGCYEFKYVINYNQWKCDEDSDVFGNYKNNRLVISTSNTKTNPEKRKLVQVVNWGANWIHDSYYIDTRNDRDLEDFFKNKSNENLPIAICGNQSHGKTTLVRKFVIKNRTSGYFELNAANQGTLEQYYRSLAKELEIKTADTDSIDMLIQNVNADFREMKTHFFLIFDSAENYAKVFKYFPDLENSKVRVIVTTQERDFFPYGKGRNCPIQGLMAHEAETFIEKSITNKIGEIQALINFLSCGFSKNSKNNVYNRRDLVELIAYIKTPPGGNTTVQCLIKSIKFWKKKLKFIKRGVENLLSLAIHSLLLQTLIQSNDLNSSFDEQDEPKKQLLLHILNICSFLDSENINSEIIKKLVRRLYQDAIKDEEINQALDDLKNYFFLEEITVDAYIMHTSVQSRQRCLLCTSFFTKNDFYFYYSFCLSYFQLANITDNKLFDSRRGNDLEKQKIIIPHIESLATIKLPPYSDQPWKYTIEIANMLNWLGYTLMQLDQYERAKGYLERANILLVDTFPLLKDCLNIELDNFTSWINGVINNLNKYKKILNSYSNNLRFSSRLPVFTKNTELEYLRSCEKNLRLALAIKVAMKERESLESVFCYDDLGCLLLHIGCLTNDPNKLNKSFEIFSYLSLKNDVVKNEIFRQYKCQVRFAILYKLFLKDKYKYKDKDILIEKINESLKEAEKLLAEANAEANANKSSSSPLRNIDVYIELMDWYLSKKNPDNDCGEAEKYFNESNKLCEHIRKFNENSASYASVLYYKARLFYKKVDNDSVKCATQAIDDCLEIQKRIFDPSSEHIKRSEKFKTKYLKP